MLIIRTWLVELFCVPDTAEKQNIDNENKCAEHLEAFRKEKAPLVCDFLVVSLGNERKHNHVYGEEDPANHICLSAPDKVYHQDHHNEDEILRDKVGHTLEKDELFGEVHSDTLNAESLQII